MKPLALIFDDQEIRHKNLGAELESSHEVRHAHSVAEALHALKTEHYDYLSLDHDMGKTDGHENPSGTDLVRAMIAELPADRRPRRTRIHSWNPMRSIEMLKDLRGAGFPDVSYAPAQVGA